MTLRKEKDWSFNFPQNNKISSLRRTNWKINLVLFQKLNKDTNENSETKRFKKILVGKKIFKVSWGFVDNFKKSLFGKSFRTNTLEFKLTKNLKLGTFENLLSVKKQTFQVGKKQTINND